MSGWHYQCNWLDRLNQRMNSQETEHTNNRITQGKKVALVNSTTDTLKKPRLWQRTDRALFSHLLRHPVMKQSGSILSTPEPRAYARGRHEVLPPSGCTIVHINNIRVSGETILSVENSGKPLGGRGFTPNSTGELTALPRSPRSGWRGCCPLPRTHPQYRPSSVWFGSSQWKIPCTRQWIKMTCYVSTGTLNPTHSQLSQLNITRIKKMIDQPQWNCWAFHFQLMSFHFAVTQERS